MLVDPVWVILGIPYGRKEFDRRVEVFRRLNGLPARKTDQPMESGVDQ